MSKLSQLKQKAYQAGKSRNWDEAIACYEQILELEKNNPTVVNELGDLCLKAGEIPRAVKHFLTAASRYRKTGLFNNSVAIYKKILRHDEGNLNAHWYLADIRAGQGLSVEGQEHATRFLAGSEAMGGEVSEIFQKRFVKLFELYPTSSVILERLLGIFRTRDMSLEAARAELLVACCMFTAGDQAAARKRVDGVVEKTAQVRNYPEYNRWMQLLDPNTCQGSQEADFNTVSFDNDVTDETAAAAPEIEIEAGGPAAAVPEVEIDAEPDAGIPEIKIEIEPEAPAADGQAAVEVDGEEDGCISIDMEANTDFSDLIAAATGDAAPGSEDTADRAEEVFASNPVEPAPAADEADEEKVDLLAQILSEEGASLDDGSDQVNTISAEIGSVVGGDGADDDAGRLYEMGMVYLEMGMFDQACGSFSVAACDEEFALRAHEMWGMTLQRANNPDESIKVLTEGLTFAADGSRENLTLRYHIARAHEMAERAEAAKEIYQDICEIDQGFLDVKKRRDELAAVL